MTALVAGQHCGVLVAGRVYNGYLRAVGDGRTTAEREAAPDENAPAVALVYVADLAGAVEVPWTSLRATRPALAPTQQLGLSAVQSPTPTGD